VNASGQRFSTLAALTQIVIISARTSRIARTKFEALPRRFAGGNYATGANLFMHLLNICFFTCKRFLL